DPALVEKTIRYVPDFAKPVIDDAALAIEDLEALPTVQPVEDATLKSPFAEKTLRYVPPFARRKSLRPQEEQVVVRAAGASDFQARALSLWLLEIEKGQPAKTEAAASQVSAGLEPQRSVRKSRSS